MDIDILLGCIIIIAALAFVILIVLWSRGSINRIARSNLRSAREIQKEIRHEQ